MSKSSSISCPTGSLSAGFWGASSCAGFLDSSAAFFVSSASFAASSSAFLTSSA